MGITKAKHGTEFFTSRGVIPWSWKRCCYSQLFISTTFHFLIQFLLSSPSLSFKKNWLSSFSLSPWDLFRKMLEYFEYGELWLIFPIYNHTTFLFLYSYYFLFLFYLYCTQNRYNIKETTNYSIMRLICCFPFYVQTNFLFLYSYYVFYWLLFYIVLNVDIKVDII